MGRGKLGIISDTAVTQSKDGTFRGYEPVVKEIDYFLQYWDKVEWLAYLYSSTKTVYSDPLSKEVEVKGLRPLGGTGLLVKLTVLINYLNLFVQVYKVIKASQDIHVRAPAHPAICAMLLAPLFSKKTFWFKYAGSWIDEAPISYNLQRKLLKKISKGRIFTTINGQWPDSNSNIIAFENPCFSEKVYEEMTQDTPIEGTISNELRLIYVGALSEFKGVQLVMGALENMGFQGIDRFTIIGTGEYEKNLVDKANASPYKNQFDFQGKKNKDEVFKFLKASDLLIIASKTEGFPKVISEAMMNYCVPISTRVSCIEQYIDEHTGFIIEERTEAGVEKTLLSAVSDQELNQKKINCRELAGRFTYENYLHHLLGTIFVSK
ncbi:MAG: hypothetical protein Sapg2KO_47230 [Saprospiraceae bacterium]